MKPELIFVSERDGMVTLPKEDIIRLVDRAYQCGKADATNITTTPWTISPIWADGSPRPAKYTEVTCETGGNKE